jgi:hypothetical protein
MPKASNSTNNSTNTNNPPKTPQTPSSFSQQTLSPTHTLPEHKHASEPSSATSKASGHWQPITSASSPAAKTE